MKRAASIVVGLALILAAVLAVQIARLPAVPLPETKSAFDPIAFFEGGSRGTGTISLVTGQTRALRVESMGLPQDDGALWLEQRIFEEGKAPRKRLWILRPLGDGRFGGSLTDATGPVTARVAGNRMTIAYDARGDVRIEQELALAPDGTVRNRLDVYKWGLNVARLDERIHPD
ncbi:DUF3833 family protein [Sphingomicrobium arenosum]|uniref:DUF3833 family protein n=1 Tax=Sphingomicrobium arenosum TaxID=2233861 RepID=UPI00223EE668|nr:DUF3833 family protein [Sphingomicrobium arenosum]